jgi:cytochrome b pre-mRNA-processing protein 3
MMLPAFRRSFQRSQIHALYGAIVAQARLPVFYVEYGVPDTLQGRFELIVLHLVLVLRRLDQAHELAGGDRSGRAQRGSSGQRLFDAFCRDLDHSLREMGVGDLAVPREMRRFGEAFYGRQAAYRTAFEGADDRELEKAFARNIYGVAAVDPRASGLARYARAVARSLDGQEDGALAAGRAAFPSPEAFVHA